MPQMISPRHSGALVRASAAAGMALALLLPGGCTNPFDTDVENPNAVVEDALNDPAGATTLVNGQGASVTRALTAVYGPYHVATDELTWVGSREFWKNLNDGDVSDPVNEYSDGAYPYVSEGRWLSNFTMAKMIAFDAAGQLRDRRDYVRSHIYAAIIYTTIGDMFDDFVLESDRTIAAANVGEAGMPVFYDSAVVFLDRAMVVATDVGDVELQKLVLGLRARTKYSRALWNKIKPARTVPVDPLVSDAGATADATAALALMAPTYRYNLTPTANNLAGINIGFETNNRGELRADSQFVNADPTRPIVPAPGLAGIAMIDPVTGAPSTTVAIAIDACCRPDAGNNVPMTQVSAREMMLILAEERLAAADDPNLLSQINASRAVDALPPYPDATNPLVKLEYERKVQLYLQGRRLMDMYRFGTVDPKWLGSTATSGLCFLPISYSERQQNLLAPQPNNARLCN
jgi:hypothetical protein